MALVGLLLVIPTTLALAMPAGQSAPVVDIATPVVAFYAGTAEIDGSTTVEPTTTGTRSRLDCTILFAKDSDVLRPGARERLRRLADQLHAQGAGKVAVNGYTDDLGSAAHGLDLSQRRARRVAHELARVLPAKRYPMKIRGLGEAQPAVPNTSEANRRKNRRVTVTLTRTAAPAPESPQSQPEETPTPSPQPTPTHTSTPTGPVTPSPSSVSATSASTPAAAPPPLPPEGASGPSGPARLPWLNAGLIGALLIGLGLLADLIRRRRHQSPAPASRSDPDPTGPEGAMSRSDSAEGFQGASEVPATSGFALTAATTRVPVGSTSASEAATPVITAGSVTTQLEAELAADLAVWASRDTHRPRLTLLGPVHARTRGQALARRRPFYTELFAYLALHPQGATVDQIADDLHLTPARVRTDMKILRDWLGADPTTGRSYLPDARTTPAAERRGIAVYQLDNTLTDLILLERLANLARTKTGKARAVTLRQALELVSGRPFDHTRTNGWAWLFEGERADLRASKTLTDIAIDLIDYHHGCDDDTATEGVQSVLSKAGIDPSELAASEGRNS